MPAGASIGRSSASQAPGVKVKFRLSSMSWVKLCLWVTAWIRRQRSEHSVRFPPTKEHDGVLVLAGTEQGGGSAWAEGTRGDEFNGYVGGVIQLDATPLAMLRVRVATLADEFLCVGVVEDVTESDGGKRFGWTEEKV